MINKVRGLEILSHITECLERIGKSELVEKIEQEEILMVEIIKLPEIFELFSKPYLNDEKGRYIIDQKIKKIPHEFYKKEKRHALLTQITYNSIESNFEEFQEFLVGEVQDLSLDKLQ